MGWKGTLRSMGAASRAAARASERRSRTISKLHAKATSVLSSLDDEVEKEIRRVEEYEEKISASPVKKLQLWYDTAKGWTTAPLVERTGRLTYTLEYKVPTQDVTFEPSAVEVGGVRLTPRAISVSQYFTAVAFDAATGPGEGGRLLKLVSPSKPELSRIALASPSGEIFGPLDTNLDGRVFAGTSRSGVISFEPFGDAHDYFEILFDTPAKKSGTSDTVRIRVTSPAMHDEMAACLGGPSILEGMTEKFRAIQEKTHAETAEQVKKASTGCVLIIWLWLTGLAAAVAALTSP